MDSELKTAVLYVPKGGVAKTTSAAHIAVSAVQDHDLRTLVIDLAGRQNDVARQFGMADKVDEPRVPVSTVFGDSWDIIVDKLDDVTSEMVLGTDEGPDIIPSDPKLNSADNNLANEVVETRYEYMGRFVESELADRYDFVLVDLPGKEDNIALNGLMAVEDTIAPVRPGEFEEAQLSNLQDDLNAMGESFDGVDPRLSLVIPTMIQRTTNQSSDFLDDLEAAYPDRVTPPVVQSANIGAAQSEGKTLFAIPDDELYQTGRDAKEAYRQITTQLLERL